MVKSSLRTRATYDRSSQYVFFLNLVVHFFFFVCLFFVVFFKSSVYWN